MPSRIFFARPISMKIVIVGAAALLLIALSVVLAYKSSSRESRKQVLDAIGIMAYAKSSVAAYMRDKEKFPTSIDETGFHPTLPPHISTLNLRNGVIVATFGSSANSTIQEKDVVYVPRIAQDGLFTWTCGSTTLAHDLLPEDCRAKDLSTNIVEQLEKRRKDSIAATEAAKQTAYGDALGRVRAMFPQLDPNRAQYDEQLATSFEGRAAEHVRRDNKDFYSALEYAAKEVLYEDYERRARIYQEASTKETIREGQRIQEATARLKNAQNRMMAIEARNADYAQQAAYNKQLARQEELRQQCRFLFYVNNDPTGLEWADLAKQECLASDGRQGPAYSRWREHRESETTRRKSVAPRYNSGSDTNCVRTGYREANCSTDSWSAPASQPDLVSDLN